jgi:hypothetical protein
MKIHPIQIATYFLTAILLAFSTNLYTQRTITWKGGTPGMKTDWYCSQNWSTSTVPDEFSNVIIPDVSTSTFAMPVIPTGSVEINELYIQSNASLTVSGKASLCVFGNTDRVDLANLHGEGRVVFNERNQIIKMITEVRNGVIVPANETSQIE